MKTAISIPDKLFDAADKYAKAHGLSRSNLYAKAIQQFLDQNPADHITSQLNEVYKGKDSKLNKAVASLQFHSIEKEEW